MCKALTYARSKSSNFAPNSLQVNIKTLNWSFVSKFDIIWKKNWVNLLFTQKIIPSDAFWDYRCWNSCTYKSKLITIVLLDKTTLDYEYNIWKAMKKTVQHCCDEKVAMKDENFNIVPDLKNWCMISKKAVTNCSLVSIVI